MHYTSKFVNSFSKKILFDLDKKLNLKKNKERILPLGNCFLDIFAKEMLNLNYNVCDNSLNKMGKK